MLYRAREGLADVRSTGFSRNPGEEPPKGGTTNGAFPGARSVNAARRAPWVAVLLGMFWVTPHGASAETASAPPKPAVGMDAAHVAEKPTAANEPFLRHLSLAKAAEYLDAGAHAHEKHCFACHATFAYLAARPAISTTTATHRATRQALEQFAAGLAGEKLSPTETPPLHVSEVVMAATVLAQHDAATGGKLHALTRSALDRIWDLQRPDGGWNWNKVNAPPSEIDDHFGVTTAAIGVAAAPDRYAETPRARRGLDGIRRYLREHPPATMHQRALLLLAAGHMEGLLTKEQIRQAVAGLLGLQRPDGGWSMASLGNWKRADGAPPDDRVSDGYGTGLGVYVLRRGEGLRPMTFASTRACSG